MCQIFWRILRQIVSTIVSTASAWRMKISHTESLKYEGWKILESKTLPRTLLIRVRKHGQQICRENEGK